MWISNRRTAQSPWNKGKLVGQKLPLTQQEIWTIRLRLDAAGSSLHLSTRQYARIVDGWVAGIGLDRASYGTHSMRRTKATLIYWRTKNLRAVQGETRKVGPGDLIFIPRNTVHGPMVEKGQRFAALSVFAPFFDRSKTNIQWQQDETP